MGSPALPGSASYASGTFTVNGAGVDIETNSDQFHYVYQPFSGDVTVVARVTSIQNTDPWAKGGVMIRETLAADSKHAMTVLTPGNGVAFQRRLATGGLTFNTSGPLVAAPYWVRVVRSGDTFSGYSSADGIVWTLVGSDTIPMSATAYVGLPLTSHNPAAVCTATFDNVTVTAGTCTAGNVLVDGGFEATDPGTLVNPNWAATSTQFGTPLCGPGGCGRTGTAAPFNGSFWAWFGGTTGVNAEVASLSQTVTFPTGASSVTLSFYLWVSAVTAPFTDTLEVQVDGVTQQTFTEPAAPEGGYTQRFVGLNAFDDGASHTLTFLYTQPAGGGTGSFNVDDATLDVVCSTPVGLLPAALAVDPLVNGTSNGNGVLEMNETAIVDPSWYNNQGHDETVTGTASNLTGVGPAAYTILDPAADYGLIPAGTAKDCLSGTPDCYVISIDGLRTDQPVHFDATIGELVEPTDLQSPSTGSTTWTLHVGGSFADVSTDTASNPFYPTIETVLHNGVTAGCGTGTTYCPLQNVLRQEMAVFLLKSALGSGYVPPACTPPGIFTDVPCPGLYTDWIEDLSNRGITAGCAFQPGPPPTQQYCPDASILRQEMAVFLIKTSQGTGYTPPACTPPGIFSDVPCPGLYTDYIEDLYNRGLTAGCSSDPGPPPTIQFCPTDSVTRQEMAAFLTTTFHLVLYGP